MLSVLFTLSVSIFLNRYLPGDNHNFSGFCFISIFLLLVLQIFNPFPACNNFYANSFSNECHIKCTVPNSWDQLHVGKLGFLIEFWHLKNPPALPYFAGLHYFLCCLFYLFSQHHLFPPPPLQSPVHVHEFFFFSFVLNPSTTPLTTPHQSHLPVLYL